MSRSRAAARSSRCAASRRSAPAGYRALLRPRLGELTLDDVQARADRGAAGKPPPPEAGPQLLTRRQDLHGRTPHQIEYIEKILAHDCTIASARRAPADLPRVAFAVDALARDK